MAKDEKEADSKAEEKAAPKEDKKAAAKDAKQDSKNAKKGAKPSKDAKKDAKPAKKEEQEEIPMDAAAIKAYSSVIADAAEDSEPQTPVEYHAVITEEAPKHEVMSSDPMASMIQNEISEIKDASIKAAKDKSDE